MVVGGGTAGAVVAGRLAERGDRQVLLLEAGPDPGPRSAGRWPADLLDPASLPSSHDWGYTGPGAGGHELLLDRARVIGGCSAHNGCTQTWGWRGDYDAWGRAGCEGWSGAALEPYLERATDRMRVRRYRDEEVQPFQRAFVAAAGGMGVPHQADLDDLDGGVGTDFDPVNIVNGERWNTSFAYLDPVRDSAQLTILGNALVERVVLERGGAVAVEAAVEGRRERIDAAAVVLAGGSYGSPAILLRSGVGPADHLAALGVSVAVGLAGVGGNLHDQVAAELEFFGTPLLERHLAGFAAERMLPQEQAIAKLRSARADGPFDLHLYPWVEPDEQAPHTWRCVLPISLLTPASRGSLRLRSVDATQPPMLDHGFLPDPVGADTEALLDGVEAGLEILARDELGEYLGEPRFDREVLRDRAAAAAWVREHHTHYWHPAGTCRMGPVTAPEAVVDGEVRVRGCKNLHVIDASVFPAVPRGTPALPVVALAELLTARLA